MTDIRKISNLLALNIAATLLIPVTTHAVCIGNNYEQVISDKETTLPELSVTTIPSEMETGKSITLQATGVVDVQNGGGPAYFWCAQEGSFDALSSDYSTVRYTAPNEVTTFKLAVQLGDNLGYIHRKVFDITVTSNASDLIEDSDGNTTGQATCQLYAVHDEALNNTQFFAIDVLNGFKVNLLGELHLGKDIEALTIHPETNQLFAASGKDGNPPGYLYHVNAITGELTEVGEIRYQDINGIAFNPQDQSLWGWAVGNGLIQINLTTAESSLHLPFTGHVEDIAWNNSGDTLYAVADNKFYSYTPVTETVQQLDCKITAGEIEAIEIMPGGNDQELLYSTHNDKTLSIHKLNIQTCETAELSISTEVDGIDLNDVEGIALPVSACYR